MQSTPTTINLQTPILLFFPLRFLPRPPPQTHTMHADTQTITHTQKHTHNHRHKLKIDTECVYICRLGIIYFAHCCFMQLFCRQYMVNPVPTPDRTVVLYALLNVVQKLELKKRKKKKAVTRWVKTMWRSCSSREFVVASNQVK